MDTKKPPIITMEQLAALKAELAALPQKTQQTKRAVVEGLHGAIAVAVDRGYSYAQVADMLRAKGVSIAPGTLQRYMRQAGVIRRKSKR